ncbi:MAG TPA: hypothetical protein VNO43_12145 [Candidatus Eisenbacteria bacterium]|nr:hypothetical protein [Candidatus Eisenbacteria bacterium]
MDVSEPRLDVKPLYVKRDEGDDRWLVAWQVANSSPRAVTIVSARLPHSRFRAEKTGFSTGISVPADGRCEIILPARFRAAPDGVVENAFLILSIKYEGLPWRIFARFRVNANARGEPEPAIERITTQRVGFSGLGG